MTTPLTIAFVWHMHQPWYKDRFTGHYHMPWVRLHATKDYLDMVTICQEFPKIKQTFNLVPSLIEQLRDYTHPETHDTMSQLSLQSTWTPKEAQVILERGFDANYYTMVNRNPRYAGLCQRRNQTQQEADDGGVDVSAFTQRDLGDILAMFNLVWIDPIWFEKYPPLKALWDKGHNYTVEDRAEILDWHRKIITDVLPTYQSAQANGQIDVITSPYYHPIMPLLIDSECAKIDMPDGIFPTDRFAHPEDAQVHLQKAMALYTEIFGQPPVGMWPSEQSVSPATVDLLHDHGIQWTLSSEGVLSRSLGIHWDKDGYGNILNAQYLCRPYEYNGVAMLFRHLTLSDLIGFHYAHLTAPQAVQDFMSRVKLVQQRCELHRVENPILTIALDGENCWENYTNDGRDFLTLLYQTLSDDPTLNVSRVSDYLAKVPSSKRTQLPRLHSGSWINDNFHIWIGEPVKNAAWNYLKKTRDDLNALSQLGTYTPDLLEKAWEEIYITEGSDWFWWFGEPHNSGQDDRFDWQFRQHLATVYQLLDKPVPDYLNVPLMVSMGKQVIEPKGPITPSLSGNSTDYVGWECSGILELAGGAMHDGRRILHKVLYGSDEDTLFIRLILHPERITPHHELAMYICTPGKTRHNSPVRSKLPAWSQAPTLKYLFAYEVRLSQLDTPDKLNIRCAQALSDYLWQDLPDMPIQTEYENSIDLAIPFDALHSGPGEYIQCCFATLQGDVIELFTPEHFPIATKRYERSAKYGFEPDHITCDMPSPVGHHVPLS